MKIKKLLKNIDIQAIKGSKEVEITGICSNSKLVAPGNLFIAKKSGKYIAEAVSAGAVAILTDIFDPFLQNVVQLIHPDPGKIEGEIADNYYQGAHRKLFSVAFTGTNGKTTGTFLTKHLLDGLRVPCGLIGTIEWNVGHYTMPSTHTTPDIVMNHKLFYEMVQNQCKAVAMEVSSHALHQERVKGLRFDVAVFTNLTQDHLDYHKTMEEYAQAKSKLFTSHAKASVINQDSEWARFLTRESQVPILTYGIDRPADLRATDIELSSSGIKCQVFYRGKSYPFTSQLIGRFNIYNCLAAIGVGLTYGATIEQILPILTHFSQVRGRLERVTNDAGLNVFVDYAHTDDALRNVLETLKELKKGRLVTLFGCGGDRDRSKRPKMAAIAELLSDVTILTSDNPRNEDPIQIIHEVMKGFKHPKEIIIEPDRSQAIAKAIKMATQEDIVLIAGKGHETYQIFAHETIAFDDRKIAENAILTLTTNR